MKPQEEEQERELWSHHSWFELIVGKLEGLVGMGKRTDLFILEAFFDLNFSQQGLPIPCLE